MPLLFGPSGIPASTVLPDVGTHAANESTHAGIERVAELGLGCMEMAFVHGVYIKEPDALDVKETAKKCNVSLSCHAPYYINLNAKEAQKVAASRQYILRSAKIANMCGADTVVFHAGYYLGQDPAEVYDLIKKEVKALQDELDKAGNPIRLRPEVSGKASQFGSVEELVRLIQDDGRISMCIDMAHWHARDGKFNSYEEFDALFQMLDRELGDSYLKNVHFHVSGIDYGDKGEKKHLPLQESDLRFEELLKSFADHKLEGKVICESPNQEVDALLLQSTYQKILASK